MSVASSSAEVQWRQALVHGGGSASSCGVSLRGGGGGSNVGTPGPGSYRAGSTFDKASQPRADRARRRPSSSAASSRRSSRTGAAAPPAAGAAEPALPPASEAAVSLHGGGGGGGGVTLRPSAAVTDAGPLPSPRVLVAALQEQVLSLQQRVEEADAAIALYPPMSREARAAEAEIITQRALACHPSL
eukprot:Rhum_TRINITY_DN9913_c0_g1::Rhum_TRINITY_DN9913_c0_g1_i1::g.35913::m.35913